MIRRKSENIKLTMPISESRDHIQGPANAPITLVEYGDYECPYCAQAYIIIKEVQERLGGKLREMYDYLFKHGQWITNDDLRQSAAKLGLGLDRFDRDFLDHRYSSRID